MFLGGWCCKGEKGCVGAEAQETSTELKLMCLDDSREWGGRE